MFEFSACRMKLSVYVRCSFFMNPQYVWFRDPSLAEATVLRQMLSVQVRLRDDALMCTQLLHNVRSLQ